MEKTTVGLRPARAEDCRRVFDWASDVETRRGSFTATAIELPEHERWYAESLAGGGRRLLIAEVGGAAVGLIRFDDVGDEDGVAELGITVAPSHRGRGLATRLIDAAREEAARLGYRLVVARVRQDNQRSMRTFDRAAGFGRVGPECVKGIEAVRYEAEVQ